MSTNAMIQDAPSQPSVATGIFGKTSSASDSKQLSSWLLKTPALLQHFIWPGTQLVLRFFIRFTVKGRENLNGLPAGVIFAANHSSELDPILIPAAMDFTSKHLGMFYTSRETSFYKNSGWRKIFYGGFFFKIWGAYPVIVGSHNYDLSLRNHTEILKRNHPVCIFPEGKKTLTGEHGEAKGGIGYLSYMTKAPIIPVAIQGVYKMTSADFFLRRRTVTLSFGKPLYPRDIFSDERHITIRHEHDDCRIAAARVMAEVRKLKSA